MKANAVNGFFNSVRSRLETVWAVDRELDRELARRFNTFRYLRTDELGLSKVIADLLDPKGDHGQGSALLHQLLRRLDFPISNDLAQAQTVAERSISNQRRIDIVVEIDNDHCLAIENKPYATDQEKQIADYLHWLCKRYSNFILVYLSPRGHGPSTDSVTVQALQRYKEGDKRFAIVPYVSNGVGEDDEDEFQDFRVSSFSLIDWLADCRRNCDVERLRWFLKEAETFLVRQWGGESMDKEKDEIESIVLADDAMGRTALAVYESWPRIKAEMCLRFLKHLERPLLDEVQKKIGGENWVLNSGSFTLHSTGKKQYPCLYLYRSSWRTYDAKADIFAYTCICFANDQDWDTGVLAPLRKSKMASGDQEHYEILINELHHTRPWGGPYDPWLCWSRVDEDHRNWDNMVPALHRECNNGGGPITAYLIQHFVEVAKFAVPVIDKHELR